MLGCVLARRTVAASDVPALRAPAEMKPPTFRRCQAFHTPVAARLRSGVDSAPTFLHFDLSSLLTRCLPSPNSLAGGLRTLHRAFAPRTSRWYSFKRQSSAAIGRWYWRCPGLRGAWDRVAFTFGVSIRLVIFTCMGKLPAKWYHSWYHPLGPRSNLLKGNRLDGRGGGIRSLIPEWPLCHSFC